MIASQRAVIMSDSYHPAVGHMECAVLALQSDRAWSWLIAVACRSLKFNGQPRYALPEENLYQVILRQLLVNVPIGETWFERLSNVERPRWWLVNQGLPRSAEHASMDR
ncbi:hypothetical protein ACVIN2_005857 [Bradyrhizobium sp. USDA 3650]